MYKICVGYCVRCSTRPQYAKPPRVTRTPPRLYLVFNKQLYLTLLYSRIPVYFKHTAVSLIGSVDSSREFGHAALALFAPPFAPVDVPASAAAGGLAVAEVVRGLGVGLRLNVTFQDYEFQRTSRHCRVSRWRNFFRNISQIVQHCVEGLSRFSYDRPSPQVLAPFKISEKL